MEKKNMDKIDTLYDYVIQKREELEERINDLNSSLLTNDIRKILTTIKEVDPYFGVYVSNEDSIDFWNTTCYSEDDYALKDHSCEQNLKLFKFFEKEYSNQMVRKLKNEIQHNKKVEDLLSMIENNIEKIISDISNKYKSISEKQGDALDELFSLINYDTTPTKHLKITVEWI